MIAIAYFPVLARMPMADVHHNVAAVFMPRTVPLSLKITPLHRKPTPDMMLLPTRNISSEPYSIGNSVKKLVPMQIKTLMRIPAGCPVN